MRSASIGSVAACRPGTGSRGVGDGHRHRRDERASQGRVNRLFADRDTSRVRRAGWAHILTIEGDRAHGAAGGYVAEADIACVATGRCADDIRSRGWTPVALRDGVRIADESARRCAPDTVIVVRGPHTDGNLPDVLTAGCGRWGTRCADAPGGRRPRDGRPEPVPGREPSGTSGRDRRW